MALKTAKFTKFKDDSGAIRAYMIVENWPFTTALFVASKSA